MRRSTRASFSGLQPGGAIEARDAFGARRGAIACVLVSGESAEPTHLLTAGHLFHPHASSTEVWCAPAGNSATVLIGHLDRSLLSPAAVGERALDVALVTLTSEGVALAKATSTRVKLDSIERPELVRGRSVRAWLAVRGTSSKPCIAHVRTEAARMYARHWLGGYVVRDVIGVAGCWVMPGDSGTALMTEPDEDGLITLQGVCVGQLGNVAIFEPVYGAVERLIVSSQQNLSLWRQ